MRQDRIVQIISLFVISTLLVGCGGGSNSTTTQGLSGSLVKGPIDRATVTIYDANGKTIASTISQAGKFELPNVGLTSSFYTIESTGGSYEDEATGQTVTLQNNEGLKTLLTKEEFQDMLSKKEFAAITPETTIFTELVETKLADNNLSSAITQSEQIVYDLMINYLY